MFQSGSLKSSASGSSSRATTDNFQLSVHRPPAVPLHTNSPGRDLEVRYPADWNAAGDTEDNACDAWMSNDDLSARSARGRTLNVPVRGKFLIFIQFYTRQYTTVQ